MYASRPYQSAFAASVTMWSTKKPGKSPNAITTSARTTQPNVRKFSRTAPYSGSMNGSPSLAAKAEWATRIRSS